MRFRNWLVLFLSISALPAADKEVRWTPGPVESYPHRVTSEKVSLAAEPFEKRLKLSAFVIGHGYLEFALVDAASACFFKVHGQSSFPRQGGLMNKDSRAETSN